MGAGRPDRTVRCGCRVGGDAMSTMKDIATDPGFHYERWLELGDVLRELDYDIPQPSAGATIRELTQRVLDLEAEAVADCAAWAESEAEAWSRLDLVTREARG